MFVAGIDIGSRGAKGVHQKPLQKISENPKLRISQHIYFRDLIS